MNAKIIVTKVKILIMNMILMTLFLVMLNAENYTFRNDQPSQESISYKHGTMDFNNMMLQHMKRAWEDPEWILEQDINSDVKEFLYRVHSEFGPWIYPIAILFILVCLIIALISIAFSILLGLLLIFIVIKIIQYMVRGKTEENNPTAEADAIGVNVYYLYLVSLLLPILSLAGIIIAYIYKNKSSDWMKTHYRFQIRTFWIGLLYTVLSSIFTFLFIGFLGYIFLVVWLIIRSVQGIRAFKENQAIAKPETWLWN